MTRNECLPTRFRRDFHRLRSTLPNVRTNSHILYWTRYRKWHETNVYRHGSEGSFAGFQGALPIVGTNSHFSCWARYSFVGTKRTEFLPMALQSRTILRGVFFLSSHFPKVRHATSFKIAGNGYENRPGKSTNSFVGWKGVICSGNIPDIRYFCRKRITSVM